MTEQPEQKDYLWLNLKDLPYFRALLRAVEAAYYQDLPLASPMLDLGCGDGDFAVNTFDRQIDVGLDPWLTELKQAAGTPAYRLLLQADGGRLPFPDGYFNTVVSNSVLEHIPHVDEVIREVADDVEAVAEFQRRMAGPICAKFMPIFEASGGREGHVSIQGDPLREHDANVIIHEAHANLKVAPNVCIKIPTTAAGLKAMETLIPEGTTINATEIFAVQQGLDLGELYEKLVPKGQNGPKLYYSHIAGIYDDHLKAYVKNHQVDISLDLLVQGGLAASRKLYGMVKQSGYRMTFIGGGARGLHHFTELVGG
ncbi:MAG: transaldolase family protein, partial [Anaerolineaceae bacterium]